MINRDTLSNLLDNAGMLIVFIILFVALSIFVPYFFTIRNMLGLGLSVSMVGMVACTMMFCLAAGDFDLSVEAIVPFAGVMVAMLINSTNNIWISIILTLVACSFIGLFNGVIITKFKINALITTFAVMQIIKGLSFVVSDGSAVGISNAEFFIFGNKVTCGIPNPIWVTIFCFIIFGFLLNKTVYGRDTLAIGGNKEAARLAGIGVDKVKIFIFTIQGFITGAAGIILASRMTSGQPNTAVGFSLDVISACVLGGVSLSGGIATITGTVVGVLIMGTVQNAMNLVNIPTFYQYIVRGVILLIAVLLDQFKQTRKRKKA